MKYNLAQILDMQKVEELLKSYTKATGLVSALVDSKGIILSKSGWQQICTEFHRVHPQSAKNCKLSDTTLANRLNAGNKFNVYKCLNGLIDIAVPIIVDNQHLGNLFTGQFFFEEPDFLFFKKQAKKFGYNESEYLKSLSKVPILSESDIKNKLDFFS
ncbi:PocR ligand-binding domain-containing protein [Plebeiibacterium sediminum]|uniref:PocR ligand-binding domain-containing protein n=1 Tax=Plebeiibacterium sediminum TaxID=2992112 RepID=A0AAE3M5E8_9BACT|nr:PocR ligand-binding domain-containing protein [Plebeiobacterium sediminum]MCW3787484.1 PocR ligand-binding domain-containing protein [Plebeiobacterium sediminum]